ncbi:MAG: sigma-70 family RNA polymerase sigma factor [Verrucomicrobiota bacterium]|nr:sigma-70 family RNA polymerase sigma factor [Verrucomicrobiota bacterium]
MADDAALLADYVKSGTEDAFRVLVERHLPLVYSAALRMVNGESHLAQEIAQNVFTGLAKKAPALADRLLANGEALPGWLYTSTRFAASSAIRANRRRRQYEAKAAAMSDQTHSDEEPDCDWAGLRPVLDGAMSRLSAKDRDALVLRFFQGEELNNVAKLLGLTEDAARMRINRALEKLRGYLTARGITLSSSALAVLLAANTVHALPPALAATVTTAAIGTTAAGGIAVVGFMTTKLKIAAVCALAIAGAGTPLILQHQKINTMRQENQALSDYRAHSETLRAENERLSALLGAKPVPNLSRPDHLELLRLRGEVGLLRKESQELAKLRSGQMVPKSSDSDQSPKVLKAEAWANVGLEKPEDALQTFLWGGRYGQDDLVGNAVRWRVQPGLEVSEALDQSMTNLISSTTDFAPKITGLSILDQKVEDEATVRMKIALDLADGKRVESSIQIVKDNGMWFPLFHVWTNSAGDLLATMDVPPMAQ